LFLNSQQLSLVESIDSVDYEEFLERHQSELERAPDINVLCFPPDDVTVTTFARPCRTVQPVLPAEGSVMLLNVQFLVELAFFIYCLLMIARFTVDNLRLNAS